MAESSVDMVDGPGAGQVLMKGISGDGNKNNNNKELENKVDVDARGSSGDSGFFTKRKTTPSCVSHYKMDFQNRGYAVIVNNENFHWSTGMNKRVGTDIDARNLQMIFTRLGFEVDMQKDIKCIALHELIDKYAKEDHSNSDCFMFAILSHGDNGCIYGTDGTIRIKQLVDKFRGDKCPSLAGKPKIFMFQACRGMEYEIPVSPAVDVVDAGQEGDSDENVLCVDSGPVPTLPCGSDFLFCYSVAEGFYSFRDTLFGSWYIQEFTDVMESLVLDVPDAKREVVDFCDVMTAVNRKVASRHVSRSSSVNARGKKQMPCYLSMFTKKLVLVPKNGDRPHKKKHGLLDFFV
uniref:Caspase-6 n=1 Tax=Phallusia mammillata TaxID=59560 RepID=A0A6F9D953_9ASCI|nr:caspase-6 [Phallusia mammillata]